MENEIISYFDACQREGGSLQKGMNYRRGKDYSVILMSVRPNAPYHDRVEEEGTILIYEGHDVPKKHGINDPKAVDQPEFIESGKLTENGKFHKAAIEYKEKKLSPELVRVYEKIKAGIWSYNGLFHLIDSWVENDGRRKVFKFKLRVIDEENIIDNKALHDRGEHRRIIPTPVKIEVWQRDKGKCVQCGASSDLHFDHIIPFSLGGSSTTADNIQLLCSKHNLEKRDHIE
jgi:hypothetical protein